MKVIEVLNKIKLFDDYRPNIKFKSKIYIYDNCLGNYSCGDHFGLFTGYCIDLILDDEIEIIEEDTPIEKLSGSCDITTSQTCRFNNIEVKVNEIIDKLNELEEGKK